MRTARTSCKIGWAQDPQTLNPFVGQDEEDYTVWAINWDLLVNFSPKDLLPSPGIAQSWDISDDKKTVTFHLDPGREVVRRQADHLRGRQVLARGARRATARCSPSYTDNVTSIDTPDAHTVVVHTKRPDARIVGGLFIYILPKHIWGKVPVKELTGSYKPELPLVGSGPYVVTDFQHEPDPRRWSEPELPRRRSPSSTRSSSSGTATRTPSSGRCSSARSTWSPEVSAGRLRPARRAAGHRDLRRPPRRRTRELAFNMLPGEDLPGRASSTRRSRTAPCARRSPTRSTASGSTRSPPGAPRSRPTGSCRRSTSRSTSSPRRTTRTTPTRPSRSSTTPGGSTTATAPRTKGERGALVQPLRPLGVAVQHPGGEAGRRGGRRRSASSSTSRWSARTSSTT